MARTVSSSPLRQDWYIEADRPSGQVTLPVAVLPQSLSVSLNGLLMVPTMYSYDDTSRSVYVQTILLRGDTITIEGTPK